MTLGEKIKNRRKELNMSVDELARRLGKNRATVYRYEKGDIENIPVDILDPLAKALKTTPQQLIGWKTAHKSTNINRLNNDDMTIGDVIKDLRSDAHMSIEEFSSEIGITADVLKKYESGDKQPTAGMIRTIANFQGIDIIGLLEWYLLSGEDDGSTSYTRKYIGRAKNWYSEFGSVGFDEDELNQIFQYARFVVWSRDNKLKGDKK